MKKQLSDVQKAQAIAWSQEGVKHRMIAARLDVSLSTITRLLSRAKEVEADEVPQRKQGSGIKRKADKDVVDVIRRAITKNPLLTSKQLKMKFPKKLGRISTRTIRRILLEELKMKSYVAARKPYLTKSMKERRLQWA